MKHALHIYTELEMDTTGFDFRYNDILFRTTIVEHLNETDFLGLTVSSKLIELILNQLVDQAIVCCKLTMQGRIVFDKSGVREADKLQVFQQRPVYTSEGTVVVD